MKRWLPWVLGLLVVGVLGFFGVRKYLATAKTGPQYDTVKVERGPVVARVTATGTLSALVTVQVGSQVSGRIKALYADFNSQVTKGQLLAKIDPQLFQANMAQTSANLMAAKGNLAKAQSQAELTKIQFERSKQLFEKNLIAQADFDAARAAMINSQADVQISLGSVAQATANVKQSSINLNYTDIICPVDGTVISRNVDVGQTVAASLSAPVIFTIAGDLRKMQVDTSVSESDVGKLEPSMQATFTVDAFPGSPFKGTVRQIRNAPVTVQNVVTYDAVIDVDNPDLKLRPGMTATVTFAYAERQDALRVSNAALRFKPPAEVLAAASPGGSSSAWPSGSGRPRRGEGRGEGPPGARGEGGPGGRQGGPPSDRKSLWVMRDGALKRVPVKIGITDGTYTEIVEGDIKEGDVVVTGATLPGAAPTTTSTGQPNTRGMGRIL